MEEMLDVVDCRNKVIGKERRSVIHEKLLRHRAVLLFVMDEKGRILLGRRSKEKEEYPDCWSFPVAGHVKAGESADDTIRRETMEESGLRIGAEFVKLLPAERESGNHFSYIYITRIKDPLNALKLDKRETSRLALWSKKDVEKRLESGADFSPIFAAAFRWLLKNGKI